MIVAIIALTVLVLVGFVLPLVGCCIADPKFGWKDVPSFTLYLVTFGRKW